MLVLEDATAVLVVAVCGQILGPMPFGGAGGVGAGGLGRVGGRRARGGQGQRGGRRVGWWWGRSCLLGRGRRLGAKGWLDSAGEVRDPRLLVHQGVDEVGIPEAFLKNKTD